MVAQVAKSTVGDPSGSVCERADAFCCRIADRFVGGGVRAKGMCGRLSSFALGVFFVWSAVWGWGKWEERWLGRHVGSPGGGCAA
jgi:hypothetical protein